MPRGDTGLKVACLVGAFSVWCGVDMVFPYIDAIAYGLGARK